MKRTLYTVVIIVLAYIIEQKTGLSLLKPSPQTETSSSTIRSSTRAANTNSSIQSAYDHRQSDIQVQQKGIVAKVLPDDLKGSRHQKFILKFDNLSVLVAHNIDLAPKIEGLRAGDTVEFYGEYEWNRKGGIVHWTHHDPAGRHINGWLKHKGKTYQ